MRCFFFGTLMDREILHLVIGRAVPDGAVEPATLGGYRCVTVRGEAYPCLVPAAGARVAGLLVHGLSRPELARLQFFEGDEYEPVSVLVRRADGRSAEAVVFLATDEIDHGATRWELASWQERHKPNYLARAQAWMALFGIGSLEAAESAWAAPDEAEAPTGAETAGMKRRSP